MKIMSMIIIFSAVFYLTAYNTFAGVGKDIQKGGEALERSAQ